VERTTALTLAALSTRALAVLLGFSTLAAAQVCDPEKGTVAGAVRVADRSKPPCDFVDLWAVPASGAWVSLGKFSWGGVSVPVPPGTWRFAAYACDAYFPYRQSAPVRCAKDAQGCVACEGPFDLPMYAMFGGFSGQVTLLPEDQPAGPGIPVGAASGVTCGAEKFAYTDDKGRFSMVPTLEPHRSNHWGLMVDGDGSEPGSRRYFLNADYCENGVAATTFSSADVTVNLFRAAPYMAANDPSVRPPAVASLVPAHPPRELGAGISITTGSVALDQPDLAAWGASSSLAFVRSYNSRAATQTRQTALGAGWSHTYGARLSVPAKGVLLLQEDDGATRFFQDMDGDGTFRPSVPVTEPSRITASAAGYLRLLAEGGQEEFDTQGRLRRRVDATGRATTVLRDDGGRIAAVTDPDGRKLAFAYDEEGYLQKLSMGTVVLVTYAHDDDGRLRIVTHPDGTGFTFAYDPSGQVTTVAELNGRILRTYTYEGARARSFEISGGRDRLSIEYGPLKTTVTDVLGRVTAYEWSNFRGVRRVTAVAGRCPDCAPAPVDALSPEPALPEPPLPTPARRDGPAWARVIDPPWPLARWPVPAAVEWPAPAARVSEQHSWTYDLQGRLLSHRDGDGATTSVAYDANGFPLTVTDPLGRVVKMTRDAAGRLTALTTPSVVNGRQDRATSFAYDAQGRLVARSESGLNADGSPLRATTRLSYDAAGRLTEVDAPRPDVADVTTYTYDGQGNLASVSPAEWLVRRFGDPTPLGWPRRVTEVNGRILLYTYGPLGRIESIEDGPDSTTFEYTSTGRLKKVKQPRGNGVAYTYDAYDHLVEAHNAAEHRFLYTYDMAGQRTRDQARTSTGGERERSFEYDRLGRLQRLVVADGRYEVGYDAAGRVAAFQPPGGDDESYQYDAGGRLQIERIPGLTLTLRYDGRDALASAIDSEGVAYLYTRDDLGRVSRLITPSGATTLFGYDLGGHLAWRTDGRNVTTTFDHDALGRLTAVRPPHDRPILYAYDTCPGGRGRVCDVNDQAGRSTFSYTPRGDVEEERRVSGGTTLSTAYSYDRNGNVSSLRYPSGRVVTYAWDEADFVRSVSTGASGPMHTVANVTHGADGSLSGISYANTVSLSYARDVEGHVRAVRGAPFDLSYAYDVRGDVTSVAGGDRGQTFAYGPARRMTAASGSWGSLSWSYDPAGNRTAEIGAAGSTTYTHHARTQRLDTVTGADAMAVGYDAAGRVVRVGDQRFVFDELGQLSVVGGEHRTGEYGYDYKGRRAWKTAGGTTVLYTYDGGDRLIAETSREGVVLAEYLYEGNRVVARGTRSSLAYVHVDGTDAPVGMTDAKGERVWGGDARPFGEGRQAATPRPRPTPSPTAAGRAAAAVHPASEVFNLRAGGQYFDAESGLYRSQYRTYDPRIGRYLEPNPCAEPGRGPYHNLYAYVGQNPLSFVSRRGVDVVPATETWALPAPLWGALLPVPGGASPECALAAGP
jgi:RHS repeat-associated protein